MRLELRNNLLELLTTVINAIDYISQADNLNTQAISEDCLWAFSSINNTLENNLSEYRFTFYNQQINNLQEMLKEIIFKENNGMKENNLEKIKNELNILIQTLVEEQEVKIKILFLPYKASMWDSLESIWNAAKEDLRCESFVMPIPYYERDPQGRFSKFHYDGEQFPKYVPITPYSEFDISIERPDIIYIHNPYDGSNLVTSVSPEYYSNKLKQYTQSLVYVPYFVTNEYNPNAHFFVPALKNIDTIVVQSEKIKEQYLKYLPSSKVVALGSPKIDRVLNYEKSNMDIPDSWLKLIGKKKVVLFNTSLSALLTYGNIFIEKLRYVFSTFKNREDIILLWRPHPLSENTVSSMRPQLLNDYLKLEVEFKENQIGIFDDTPDVERAITISDAYYGDGTSSLVHLYGITGKPIMIQDINLTREPNIEELLSVWFSCADFDEENAWVSNGSFNGICKVNVNTGVTDFITHIPSQKNDDILLYSNILKLENKILLTPLLANDIVEYDLSSGKIRNIPSKVLEKDRSVINNRFNAVRFNEYVFITPFSYQAIIRYDINTGEYKYYTNWYQNLKPYIHDLDSPIFANAIMVRKNKLLMACAQNNVVMELDIENGETVIHTVGKEGNNYWSMTYDGEDYWLIQNENLNNDSIVRWNFETGKTTEYSDFPIGMIKQPHNFNELIYCGEYLLAFPRHTNMILKIDVNTGDMTEFKLQLGYREGDRKSIYYDLKCNYYFAKIYKENIIAMSMFDNSLIKINLKTEEISKVKIALKDTIEPEIQLIDENKRNSQFVSDYHFNENKYFTLNKYIDKVIAIENKINPNQKHAYSRLIVNANGTSGLKIHNYFVDLQTKIDMNNTNVIGE